MFPPFFCFPQLYLLSMTPYGMEFPFGQLGSAVLSVSPQLLEQPQPPLQWSGVRSTKGLGSVQALPINTETSLYYQQCLKHKSKTQLNTLLLL